MVVLMIDVWYSVLVEFACISSRILLVKVNERLIDDEWASDQGGDVQIKSSLKQWDVKAGEKRRMNPGFMDLTEGQWQVYV